MGIALCGVVKLPMTNAKTLKTSPLRGIVSLTLGCLRLYDIAPLLVLDPTAMSLFLLCTFVVYVL
jgi:predicted membrane channel-forming protein YqfA (hemolysin III family)